MRNDFSFKKETVFACLMLVLAIVLTCISFQYPVSSSAYPRALSVFLLFLATCQIIKIILNIKKTKNILYINNEEILKQKKKIYLKKCLIIYIISALYLFGIEKIGFFISTYFFVVSIALYLGHRNKIVAFVWPAVLCFIVWCVFSWFLRVPTPKGILF